MRKRILFLFNCTFCFLLSLVFVGCGGSSGSGSGGDGYDGGDGGGDNQPPTYALAPTVSQTSLGFIFVNADGMSLYTFENDRNDSDGDGNGDSDCNSGCATTWPPMLATSTAQASEPFSIITRDGSSDRQWAFRGLPLYMYVSDSSAGDVNGEGIGNTWYVARPDPLAQQQHAQNSVGTIVVGQYTQKDVDGSGGMSMTRTDRDGFSLYTFENDRNDTDGDGAGDSDCNDSCATAWPPLYADNAATAFGDYSIINRDDGSMQWALNGLPLYFYAGDSQAGDINGDGVGSVWYLARPTPIAIVDSSAGGILASTVPVYNVDASGDQDTGVRARRGYSLYVFDDDLNDTDGDGAGDSDCNASCAVAWPPMYADPGAVAMGDFSIIDRDDATKQWAYKGEPIYFYVGDNQVGDVTGDQVATTWHLARNAPVQIFTDNTLGDIFAARGMIEDVDASGNPASTMSDKTGFTVYLFDDDANDSEGDGTGDSDCNGSCAVTWPPLYAKVTDQEGGDFTIITRDDGSLQWAYKGAPLYFFQGDVAPGDVNGVYGTWH
ncbi:MAG: hypothetical protein OQK51_09105 [Kangiellaceae bacterium]|nr:hypothetical protein [Kangiellaceae bacterium]